MLSSIRGQCLAVARGYWTDLEEHERAFFVEEVDWAQNGEIVGVRYRMEFPATTDMYLLGRYTVDCFAEATAGGHELYEVLFDGALVWRDGRHYAPRAEEG